jgi:hypothetical protein
MKHTCANDHENQQLGKDSIISSLHVSKYLTAGQLEKTVQDFNAEHILKGQNNSLYCKLLKLLRQEILSCGKCIKMPLYCRKKFWC